LIGRTRIEMINRDKERERERERERKNERERESEVRREGKSNCHLKEASPKRDQEDK
jgi:hypothetical protein